MFQPSYHCSVGKANINKRKTEDDNDGDDDEDDDDEMKEIIKTKKSADEGSGYEDETDNTQMCSMLQNLLKWMIPREVKPMITMMTTRVQKLIVVTKILMNDNKNLS